MPSHRRCQDGSGARAPIRIAGMQAFDRHRGEALGEMAADGAPERLRRGEGQAMRLEPREHLLHGVRT